MFLLLLFTKHWHNMIQDIFVGLLFILALVYIGRLLYSNFRPKNGAACPKGCGSCSAIDIKKIEAQLMKDRA
ncbi:hypothetical protein D770_23520 [Flammeovirgaceae bacterium 311]|nr:hypothetical protein D770_23520 [Flammeovirgaceae bacterium 311]